ncbi:hypothetical protein FACS1894122_14060 [Alphaproteobacteria bacterium]|nr:hypothetical protein FACS1894122_14060 [Alphaproteobacteria bacterium]
MFTFKFLRPAASQTPLSKSGKNLLMNMVNENDLRKEEYQMHTAQELERAARIERDNDFGMGR